MWIVMTSAAKMPNSCWGRYRNVALVKLTPEYTTRGARPAMISERARGVLAVEHRGHHSVGQTARCALARAVASAEAEAARRNSEEGERCAS